MFINSFAGESGALGMDLTFEGEGLEEVARNKDGDVVVRVDPRYFRPTEVETLLGDATKAKEKLGWMPRTSFADLVTEMAAADLEEARRDG